MKQSEKPISNVKDYFRTLNKNRASKQSTNENYTTENVSKASCSTDIIAPSNINNNLTSENLAVHRPKSTRLFHEGWLQTFPWLRYDNVKNTMSCSICIEANTSTNWREGISLMKKDCCVRHAASNAHMNSLKVSKLQGTMTEPLGNVAVKSEDGFIQNTYWLAKDIKETLQSLCNTSFPQSLISSPGVDNSSDEEETEESRTEQDISDDGSRAPISKKRKKNNYNLKFSNRRDYFVPETILSTEVKTEDADLAFLKSILPDMKEMNNAQKRRFKVGVLNLAGKILNESNFCDIV